MAESHVISALTAKHSELAGIIKHHQKEIDRLTDELTAVTKTIRIFDPEYPIRAIKPKQHRTNNQFFKKGEGYKLLLDILREAQKPMSTTAIVAEAIKRKGLVLSDGQLTKIKGSISGTLKNQAKRGVIQELDKINGVNMWAVG